MKKILFLLIILLINKEDLFSQTLPTVQCGIYFDYDQTGNRIKRYYDCKSFTDQPEEPSDPIGGGIVQQRIANYSADSASNFSKVVSVYPNPFIDYFVIKTTKGLPATHFHLYDSKGAIVYSGTFSESEYRINIGALVPGAYNLAVRYGGNAYYFKLIKLN